jgi:hypothetical protein
MISISDDVDLARDEVKLQIAFYATTRTYTPILELHGKADIVPDLRAAFERKDKDAMKAMIDDDLCDAIAAAGPADEVKQKVKEWEPIADRLMVAGPWYGPSSGRIMENYQALVDTFGTTN